MYVEGIARQRWDVFGHIVQSIALYTVLLLTDAS